MSDWLDKFASLSGTDSGDETEVMSAICLYEYKYRTYYFYSTVLSKKSLIFVIVQFT